MLMKEMIREMVVEYIYKNNAPRQQVEEYKKIDIYCRKIDRKNGRKIIEHSYNQYKKGKDLNKIIQTLMI